jgi:hypothetical protein
MKGVQPWQLLRLSGWVKAEGKPLLPGPRLFLLALGPREQVLATGEEHLWNPNGTAGAFVELRLQLVVPDHTLTVVVGAELEGQGSACFVNLHLTAEAADAQQLNEEAETGPRITGCTIQKESGQKSPFASTYQWRNEIARAARRAR